MTNPSLIETNNEQKRRNKREDNLEREQVFFLAVIERQRDCEQGVNTGSEDVFKLANKGALKRATR